MLQHTCQLSNVHWLITPSKLQFENQDSNLKIKIAILKLVGYPVNTMAYTQKNKTVPTPIRECVIALWAQGECFKSIASKVRISNRTASNIVTNMAEREHLFALRPGGKERTIANPNVVEFIEYQKTAKPSTSAALVRDRVCTPKNLPAKSTISDVLGKDLQYTYKKLHIVPKESRTQANQLRTLDYIMQMSEIDPNKLHFFDECSVKTTTGNRVYGHARKGQPAIEIKRYASNFNYTVNLLQSVFGVSNFGVLGGASNGLEMLHFLMKAYKLLIQFTVILFFPMGMWL